MPEGSLKLLTTFKWLGLTMLWIYLFSECGLDNIIRAFITVGLFSTAQPFLFVDCIFGSSIEGIQTESFSIPIF